MEIGCDGGGGLGQWVRGDGLEATRVDDGCANSDAGETRCSSGDGVCDVFYGLGVFDARGLHAEGFFDFLTEGAETDAVICFGYGEDAAVDGPLRQERRDSAMVVVER